MIGKRLKTSYSAAPAVKTAAGKPCAWCTHTATPVTTCSGHLLTRALPTSVTT